MKPAVRVWGLDLSTARVGIADADGAVLSIRAHAKADAPYRRLHELGREIERAIRLRPPWPDMVAVEDYALGAPGQIAKIRLGEVGGVVRTRLWELGVPFVLIPNSSNKRFATGNGNADKQQMIDRAIELGCVAAGGIAPNDDEADAWHLRRMARAAYGLEGALLAHEIEALSSCRVAW